jgi:hypothetical protein
MSALDRYRKAKSAEKMLTAHKEKSADAMKPVLARYDLLLSVVATLQDKLDATQ